MAGRKKADRLTGNDLRLLICAAIILGTTGLNSMQGAGAAAVRTQIQQALSGGVETSEVLAVMGQTLEDGGLSQVFSDVTGGQSLPAKDDVPSDQPTLDEGQQRLTDDTAASVGGAAEIVSEGGFADDVLSRTASHFPNEVDETVYALGIEAAQPVVGTRSSGFGMRVHPITGEETFHYGLDIAAPEGTDILSYAAGTVRESGENSYGKYLVVDHEGGLTTLYAHCSKLIAAEGDQVTCGQKIAEVGATGNATGNHLHIELWRAGKALDPDNYISGV